MIFVQQFSIIMLHGVTLIEGVLMNITVKNRYLLLIGLKNAFSSGLISWGTYISLQNEVIEMMIYDYK